MNNNNMVQLEKELNLIIKQIIIEIKLEKKLTNENVSLLISKLDELEAIIRNKKVIEKQFVFKIMYLFSSLVHFSKYNNYDHDIMDKILKIRVSLLKLFESE